MIVTLPDPPHTGAGTPGRQLSAVASAPLIFLLGLCPRPYQGVTPPWTYYWGLCPQTPSIAATQHNLSRSSLAGYPAFGHPELAAGHLTNLKNVSVYIKKKHRCSNLVIILRNKKFVASLQSSSGPSDMQSTDQRALPGHYAYEESHCTSSGHDPGGIRTHYL